MEKPKLINCRSISLSGKGILIFLVIVIVSFSEVHAQNPVTPVLDSISITSSNNPIISWFPNNINTAGYVIVRGEFINGNYFSNRIDTLYGIQNSNYTDYSVSACTESRWYNIHAFADGNIPDSPWTDIIKTIYLEDPFFDICNNSISLQWTKYDNMLNELGGYQILASENGGPFSVVGNTSASQNYFTQGNLSPNVTYTYKIRAVNEDGTRSSTSCERSIATRTYDKPAFSDILFATVENDEHIKLVWEADDAPISKFQIQRSETGLNFTFLAEIEDLNAYNPATSFTDTSANFYSTSYYYRIDIYDSCGKKHLESDNIARTILLTGEKTSGSEITIQWNPYEGWANGIEKFEVYQEVDGVPFPSTGPLVDLPPSETTYTNDVSGLGGGEGNFTYYVKAYENGGNAEVSLSNKITIQLETSISIPNAIIPGGQPPDNEFKPLVDFIEQGFYTLTIYNKWGEQLFESKVVADGWDGTYKGEYVPGGTYVYLIKFRDARGQDQEKRGTVTVVR